MYNRSLINLNDMHVSTNVTERVCLTICHSPHNVTLLKSKCRLFDIPVVYYAFSVRISLLMNLKHYIANKNAMLVVKYIFKW